MFHIPPQHNVVDPPGQIVDGEVQHEIEYHTIEEWKDQAEFRKLFELDAETQSSTDSFAQFEHAHETPEDGISNRYGA